MPSEAAQTSPQPEETAWRSTPSVEALSRCASCLRAAASRSKSSYGKGGAKGEMGGSRG